PVPGVGTVVGGVNVLNYGSIVQTAEGSDGSYGGETGSRSPRDVYAHLGFGSSMPPMFGMERLNGGVAAKLTSQQVSGGSLTGVGVTAGGLWETPVEGLRLGMTVDNLGAQIGADGHRLPLAWVAGGSVRQPLGTSFQGMLAADARLAVDAPAVLSVGAEL